MNNARKEILTALGSDLADSDGYCCYEILEPYVNSNRNSKISNMKILELLVSLVDESKICAFKRTENQSEEIFISTEINIWNAKSMWYRIN